MWARGTLSTYLSCRGLELVSSAALTITCKSSFTGSATLFWPLLALHIPCAHTFRQNTHRNINQLIFGSSFGSEL